MVPYGRRCDSGRTCFALDAVATTLGERKIGAAGLSEPKKQSPVDGYDVGMNSDDLQLPLRTCSRSQVSHLLRQSSIYGRVHGMGMRIVANRFKGENRSVVEIRWVRVQHGLDEST